jgi:hypothetical protein
MRPVKIALPGGQEWIALTARGRQNREVRIYRRSKTDKLTRGPVAPLVSAPVNQ